MRTGGAGGGGGKFSSTFSNSAISSSLFSFPIRFFSGPGRKKSPDRKLSIRGCPSFILEILPSLGPRRLSRSYAQAGFLTPLPFRRPSHHAWARQWHTRPKGFLLLTMGKVTAAGPSPILTGFPFKLPKERQCYDVELIRDFSLKVKLQVVPKSTVSFLHHP